MLCCEEQLPLAAIKSPRRRQVREAAVNRAAAKELSVDAAVAAIKSQLDGIFHIKRRTKHSTDDVSWWKRCFHLTLDWLWK